MDAVAHTHWNKRRFNMKIIRLLFACVTIFLLMVACAPKSIIKENQSKIIELERQLELGQKEKAELSNKIDETKSKIEACKLLNQNLTSNLQKLLERSQNLKSDLNKQKSVVNLQHQVIKLLDDTKKSIESSLKDQISAQGIEVKQAEDKLKVVLVDKVLFDSGSVDINEEGKKMLLVLAETLRENKTNHIVVQGYTDNIPPGPVLRKRFPSNWELSSARAAAVVRFLQHEGKMDPKRLSLKAYGQYAPVASNETEDGRTQNRRIEIVLDQP